MRRLTFSRVASTVPPQAWFAVSAVFHYLGPSFAVLLFPAVGVLGVAWMRIASAALIFAPITKPWRWLRIADARTRLLLIGLGACLAVMNVSFYLALERLPMSLVAAIEFVGTIGVALYGLRTGRNLLALSLAVLGVLLLIDVTWSSDPLGLFWAFLNGALFVGYIVLGHKVSERGASGGVESSGRRHGDCVSLCDAHRHWGGDQGFRRCRTAACGDWRRSLLLRHPLHLRSACDVQVAPCQLRIAAGFASGDGHACWRDRSSADPLSAGCFGRAPRHGWRGFAQAGGPNCGRGSD